MERFLALLDVHSLTTNDYGNIGGTFKDTGSELPRAILAYQLAFLHTMVEFSSSPMCPVVIDSPLQQDQDDQNISRILKFIIEQTPTNLQLVLGTVSMHGLAFDGTVIETENKNRLLRRELYEASLNDLDPYLDAILS